MQDWIKAARPAVWTRRSGVEISTSETHPARQRMLHVVGVKLTNRSDRDRVRRHPEGTDSDQRVPSRVGQCRETYAAHGKHTERHERRSTQQQRSASDLVDQVEGHQDPAEKDTVDDQVGSEGILQPDEREKVDCESAGWRNY